MIPPDDCICGETMLWIADVHPPAEGFECLGMKPVLHLKQSSLEVHILQITLVIG